MSGDVGQGTELDGLEEKAKKTGASKLYVLGPEKGLCRKLHLPHPEVRRQVRGLSAGHLVCRPCIAKALADIAIQEGADAICHGCTGKGNDQVRFELTLKAFCPDMAIIAPLARVGHQEPRRGDRLRRGPPHPPAHQPRDQLLQGQEPLAPVPRGHGPGKPPPTSPSTTSPASWSWASAPSRPPTCPPM